MIGGTDIVIPTFGDSATLDACVRMARRRWPHARFENAVTGDKYQSYSDIPFGLVQELLIYRDAQAEAAWDADKSDSPPNSMLYIIVCQDSVTIVLDDPGDPDLRALVESIRNMLRMNMYNAVGVGV